MTRDDEVLAHLSNEERSRILAMEPGMELDALVAEKVFDERIAWNNNRTEARIARAIGYDDFDFDQLPPYSTCISAAWLVVEKMGSMGWFLSLTASAKLNHWVVGFGRTRPMRGVSSEPATAPEAICKTALLAVMGL